jgi:hypothetical protein
VVDERARWLAGVALLVGCADEPERTEAWPPTCELMSTIELADPDEVAPNGKTGAQILAAIPPSLHSTLIWDLSSSYSTVEIPAVMSPDTDVDLTFTVPAQPRFYFEDREAVFPPGDIHYDVAVICGDSVWTTIDMTMVTADGTIDLALTDVTVRLVGFPDDDEPTHPYVWAKTPIPTLDVAFVQPEALPTNADKTIIIELDGQLNEGALIVEAEGSSKIYQRTIARW